MLSELFVRDGKIKEKIGGVVIFVNERIYSRGCLWGFENLCCNQ